MVAARHVVPVEVTTEIFNPPTRQDPPPRQTSRRNLALALEASEGDDPPDHEDDSASTDGRDIGSNSSTPRRRLSRQLSRRLSDRRRKSIDVLLDLADEVQYLSVTTWGAPWVRLVIRLISLIVVTFFAHTWFLFVPLNSVDEGVSGNAMFLYVIIPPLAMLGLAAWVETVRFAVREAIISLPRYAALVVFGAVIATAASSELAKNWMFPVPFTALVIGFVGLGGIVLAVVVWATAKTAWVTLRGCAEGGARGSAGSEREAEGVISTMRNKSQSDMGRCAFGLFLFVLIVGANFGWAVWFYYEDSPVVQAIVMPPLFGLLKLFSKQFAFAPTMMQVNPNRWIIITLVIDIFMARFQTAMFPYISSPWTVVSMIATNAATKAFRYWGGIDRITMLCCAQWRWDGNEMDDFAEHFGRERVRSRRSITLAIFQASLHDFHTMSMELTNKDDDSPANIDDDSPSFLQKCWSFVKGARDVATKMVYCVKRTGKNQRRPTESLSSSSSESSLDSNGESEFSGSGVEERRSSIAVTVLTNGFDDSDDSDDISLEDFSEGDDGHYFSEVLLESDLEAGIHDVDSEDGGNAPERRILGRVLGEEFREEIPDQRFLFHVVDMVGAETVAMIIMLHHQISTHMIHHLPNADILRSAYKLTDDELFSIATNGWYVLGGDFLVFIALAVAFSRYEHPEGKTVKMLGVLEYIYKKENVWYLGLWIAATGMFVWSTMVSHFGVDFTMFWDE